MSNKWRYRYPHDRITLNIHLAYLIVTYTTVHCSFAKAFANMKRNMMIFGVALIAIKLALAMSNAEEKYLNNLVGDHLRDYIESFLGKYMVENATVSVQTVLHLILK